jgi:hypothetical protein
MYSTQFLSFKDILMPSRYVRVKPVNQTYELVRVLVILIFIVFTLPLRIMFVILTSIFGGYYLGFHRNQPNHRNVFKG